MPFCEDQALPTQGGTLHRRGHTADGRLRQPCGVAGVTRKRRAAGRGLCPRGIAAGHRGQKSLRLDGPNAAAKAEQAAKLLTGGLFEIAETYSAAGDTLAESVSAAGEPLEAQLPPHGKPSYTRAS